MIYYISDTHFGDTRIMNLAKRPFKDIAEMNNFIVTNWNNVVTDNDTVYILGDVAIDNTNAKIVRQLKGHKILIKGNHDNVLKEDVLQEFESIDNLLTIYDKERSVCLCHYPLLSYENSIYGGYQIFGHIHNNDKDIAYTLQKQLPRSLNVSADVIGFTPRTLDELIKMKEQQEI